MMRLAVLLLLATIGLACRPALAVMPDEMMADPGLEARAREVSKELRCLVCRNQSVDDSDAGLAHDLRMLVRERIKAGDTNEQALDYIHARYGDYVLLRPPLEMATVLLWAGPLIVVLLGGLALWQFHRGQRRSEAGAPAPLSADERRRLTAILDRGAEP